MLGWLLCWQVLSLLYEPGGWRRREFGFISLLTYHYGGYKRSWCWQQGSLITFVDSLQMAVAVLHTKTYRPHVFRMFLFCVFGSFPCVCACAPHVCSAYRGQKRASDPLELKLESKWAATEMLGTEPRSSGRRASALNCWATTPALTSQCFIDYT